MNIHEAAKIVKSNLDNGKSDHMFRKDAGYVVYFKNGTAIMRFKIGYEAIYIIAFDDLVADDWDTSIILS